MRLSARRGLVAVTAAALLAGSLAACGSGGGRAGGGDVFVFAGSREPKVLDGAYVSDGESLRVVRQIFEGLLTTAEGGTDVQPALAERWESSPDGLNWTFTLKKGVTFHDGTPFDAAAVCSNFERWYGFRGGQQSPDVSYYWQTVFGVGAFREPDPALFAQKPEPGLYKSCQAKDESTAVVSLNRKSSTFISALSLPSFSMVSPTALRELGDGVSGEGDQLTFSGFGVEGPVGTGPYRFGSWDRGDKITLERNEDYHGEKAKIKTLVFKFIADPTARRQALESGEIDGYDDVAAADRETLAADGEFRIVERPAFNVAYIGFNQAVKPFDNPRIRQAIAHAIDREALVRAKYPAGAEVAHSFTPPLQWGHNPDVPTYAYDLERARQLLAESGVTDPTVELWYPSGVSRPYMPDPKGNFETIKADLEKAGFTVVPKTAPWTPDYLNAVDTGRAGMYLMGWTGDFGDPDNFLGTFFQERNPRFGFDNPAIFAALDAAEAESDQAKREQMYQEANKLVMEFLPGVPYVHTKPGIALRKEVQGFVASPVNNDDFSKVSFS